jgi:hypothetical protein
VDVDVALAVPLRGFHRDVYTRLTHGGTQPAHTEHSAHALAEATRGERDAYPDLPTRWAAHLHLGP